MVVSIRDIDRKLDVDICEDRALDHEADSDRSHGRGDGAPSPLFVEQNTYILTVTVNLAPEVLASESDPGNASDVSRKCTCSRSAYALSNAKRVGCEREVVHSHVSGGTEGTIGP
jgi:hypothetical protein